MPSVLLTGFGPFLDVADNPSGALVRALDGRRAAGFTLVGRTLPVSYRRGPQRALELAASVRPALVLGFGVHRGGALQVERTGRRAVGATADVDGACPPDLGEGPDTLTATLDTASLAASLQADLSDNAGSYVCNAWLYTVLRDGALPAAFVHIPPRPADAAAVLRGLTRFLAGCTPAASVVSGEAQV